MNCCKEGNMEKFYKAEDIEFVIKKISKLNSNDHMVNHAYEKGQELIIDLIKVLPTYEGKITKE